MADRIQLRRDTKANWEQYNPILLEGEPGHVLDYPNLYKMGDGVHAWNDLPYRGYNGNVTQDVQYNENSVPSGAAILKLTGSLLKADLVSGVWTNFDYTFVYGDTYRIYNIGEGRINARTSVDGTSGAADICNNLTKGEFADYTPVQNYSILRIISIDADGIFLLVNTSSISSDILDTLLDTLDVIGNFKKSKEDIEKVDYQIINSPIAPINCTWVQNQCYALNGSTIPNETYGVNNARCTIIPCEEGDTFFINGSGGVTARLWGFADENRNILTVCSAQSPSTIFSNLLIVAPKNAAMLCINDSAGTVGAEIKPSYTAGFKIDEVPTANSKNLCFSGGILSSLYSDKLFYSFLSGYTTSHFRAYDIVIPSVTLEAGKTYVMTVHLSATTMNSHIHINDGLVQIRAWTPAESTDDTFEYTPNQTYENVNITYYTAEIGIEVSVSITEKAGLYNRVNVIDNKVSVLENEIGIIAIPAAVKTLVDSTLIRLNQWNPGKEKVIFPIISDLHSNINTSFKEVIRYVTSYICDILGVSFVANLGDLGADQDGSPTTWNINDVRSQLKIFEQYNLLSKAPVVFVKGNHEAYAGYFTKSGYPEISSSEINNYVIKEYLQSSLLRRFNNLVCPLETQTYGYMDIEERKVRVIFLDTDENGSETTTAGFSQNQVNWLISTLSSTPSNYTVIVLEHRPVSYYGLYKKDNYTRDPELSDYDTWNSVVAAICKGFIAKSSGTFTKGTLTATWDFTAVDSVMVGIFCGHSHFNWNKKEDGLNMIGTQGMGTSSSSTIIPSWGTYDSPSPINVDVVAVCPSERAIKIFKIGNGGSTRDREFTY